MVARLGTDVWEALLSLELVFEMPERYPQENADLPESKAAIKFAKDLACNVQVVKFLGILPSRADVLQGRLGIGTPICLREIIVT